MGSPLKRIARSAPARLARVPSDTARAVIAHASARSRDGADAPPLRLGVATSMGLDEAVVGLMKSPRMFPSRDEFPQFAEALAIAWTEALRRDWVTKPHTFHLAPPPGEPAAAHVKKALGGYESVRFASGFEMPEGLAGFDAWREWPNRDLARMRVLRHGEPRPWVIAIHGIGMGRSQLDFRTLPVRRLHHELGYNVVLPVLPAHADRAPGPIGTEFMTKNLMQTIACTAQSVWEVRRMIGWIRETDPGQPIAVTGISLGGLITALVGSVEPGLSRAVAAFPVVDVQWVIRRHAPPTVAHWARNFGLQGSVADEVSRVINPLAMAAATPPERLRLIAGSADRFTGTGGARRLGRHWGIETQWVDSGHLTGIMRAGGLMVDNLRDLEPPMVRPLVAVS